MAGRLLNYEAASGVIVANVSSDKAPERMRDGERRDRMRMWMRGEEKWAGDSGCTVFGNDYMYDTSSLFEYYTVRASQTGATTNVRGAGKRG